MIVLSDHLLELYRQGHLRGGQGGLKKHSITGTMLGTSCLSHFLTPPHLIPHPTLVYPARLLYLRIACSA